MYVSIFHSAAPVAFVDFWLDRLGYRCHRSCPSRFGSQSRASRRTGRGSRVRRVAAQREAAGNPPTRTETKRPSYAEMEQAMGAHYYPMNQFSPAASTNASPYLADNIDDFNTPLQYMTPCSEGSVAGGIVNPQALQTGNGLATRSGGLMSPSEMQAQAHGTVAPSMISPPMEYTNDANLPVDSPFSVFDDPTFDIDDFTFDMQGSGAADTNYPLF